MADSLEHRLRASLGSRYRPERELGAGRMARVWLAQDLRHGSRVAIKVMRPEVSALLGRERFLREIRITAQLSHPHILPVLDSGDVDGLLYFVMPHAAGGSLRERLGGEAQLPADEALRLAREVAYALDYAHREGVIHRDLKPENILLQDRQAVVADFGIALAVNNAASPRITEMGLAVGTPSYMSPEQAAGDRAIDSRSDVYGLGCVLYELLSGRPPFTGPTVESVLKQHLTADLRPITALRPAVGADVADVLNRALAKAPEDRYQSAADLAAALDPSIASATPLPRPPGFATPKGDVPHPGRRRPRHARPVVVMSSVALAALVALATWQAPGLMRRLGWLPPATQPPKSWMLVAEFEGPPDDPGLASAARSLVEATLDQSQVVATVPPQQIRQALRRAGRPDSTRLTPEVARELAYRSSVRTILAGQIHRLGPGYALVLRVVDVERDSLVLTLNETARTENDLIPAAERVTRRLRASIGERAGAIRATRPVRLVITPSFEVYRKLEQGREVMSRGRFPENHHAAIRLFREAIALDADCATAYVRMGEAFLNLGMSDSSEWAFREAARRPERLGETGGLLVASILAELTGDIPGALAECDAVLARDSTHTGGWNRRTMLMARTGDLREAMRSAEEHIRLQPFEPNGASLHNLFFLSMQAGDSRRAAAALDRLPGNHVTREYGPVWLAHAEGRWFEAESLASRLLALRTTSRFARWQAARSLAGQRAARGRIAEAARLLTEARSTGMSVEGAEPGRLEERAQILLAHATGLERLLPTPVPGRDTTAALISMGLRSASLGDTTAAKRLLARLRSRPKRDLAHHGAGPAVLGGFVALRTGRWEEAVRILGPAAREEDERGEVRDRVGRPWPRWLLAEAFEKLGRADSAARYYELATSRGTTIWFGEARMLASLAHQRLVTLNARAGRLEDAERHWRILGETCTRPDPEMVPLLDEARAALVGVRAMGRRDLR